MNIQIYVYKRNFDVQKAERFFKERRIPFQTVDMKKHAPGLRELTLFCRVLGAVNLPDRSQEKVMSHPIAHTDDPQRIAEYLSEDISMIRSPIVRNGNLVTVGADEESWKSWIKST